MTAVRSGIKFVHRYFLAINFLSKTIASLLKCDVLKFKIRSRMKIISENVKI